jgi:hypothetical protein
MLEILNTELHWVHFVTNKYQFECNAIIYFNFCDLSTIFIYRGAAHASKLMHYQNLFLFKNSIKKNGLTIRKKYNQ